MNGSDKVCFLVDTVPKCCNDCLCCQIKTYGLYGTKSFSQSYNCRLTGNTDTIKNNENQKLANCPLKGGDLYL